MIRTPARQPKRAGRARLAAISSGIAGVAMLLAGCGVVAAFVPPLSVGDPLGVDGQVVTATLDDGTLATQSVSHLDETRSFDVPDMDEDLRGFSLAGFHTNAGLENRVTLTGPAGSSVADHPETFTISRAVLAATLRDDVNGSVSFTRDVVLELPFARGECDLDACTYTYVGTEALTDALNVDLTERDDLETLVSILMLRGDETPNHGTFRVAVEIDADAPLAGFTVTLELTSEGSTIRLGG